MGKNAETLRTALGFFLAGDIAGLTPCLTEDFQAHVPGNNQLSGTYKSRDEFLTGFVGTLMTLTGGKVQFDVHDAADSDEHATGIYRITATRDGKTFEWRQVNVYHVRDGKLAEVFVNIHEFEAWNAFWQ